MARVLVIDDDAGTLLGYKGVLRSAGYEVTTVALAEDGLAAAQKDPFDVVLCDQRLPDRPGLELVSQIHESYPRTAIVLITGWATPELSVEALRSGATSYATKPLIGHDLLDVVADALRVHARQGIWSANPFGYSVHRWTNAIVEGLFLSEDPTTVLAWCHGIAVARSTLQNRCADVHVTAKDSLDLMRLLRVVVTHAGQPWNLQQWLNIVDGRTARALIRRAGFNPASNVPDVDTFLLQQLLVEP